MNKQELERKLEEAKARVKNFTDVATKHTRYAKTASKSVETLEMKLTELNKAKTGRVKIGDDIKGGAILFYISNNSTVRPFTYSCDGDLDNNGSEFYDRASAELFSLREATEYKIWCKFGDGVRIVYNKWQDYTSFHKDVRFDYSDSTQVSDISNFLDSLSEEELNSLESK